MDHYLAHPEMLALLNNENLHKGKYVSKSKTMKELSSPALDLMGRICHARHRAGRIPEGVSPLTSICDPGAQLFLCVEPLHAVRLFSAWT